MPCSMPAAAADTRGFCLANSGRSMPSKRIDRMRAGFGRQIEPGNLRVEQVGVRRLLRSVQELIAIHNLHDAVAIGAVAEVDAIAARAGGHGAVQFGWNRRPGRSGLLPRQAEVANEHRMGRIAEIIDLRHAANAPAGHAGDKVGDAGVAFPPALVRIHQAVRRQPSHGWASLDP